MILRLSSLRPAAVLSVLGLAVACAAAPDDEGVASNEGSAMSPLADSCVPGTSVACNVPDSVGCAAGERYCNSQGKWGSCQPAVPSKDECGDGVDNDCDGTVDNACLQGGGGQGGEGGGSTGGSAGYGGGGPCPPNQVISCVTACGSTGDTYCRPDGKPDDCVPPEELCGNGKDDDCDGKADEDCGQTFDCSDLEPHNCNGDLGYGDKCKPEHNTNGCAWDWFQAWCHRRDEANNGPQNWDDAVKKWVDDHCDGTVVMTGNTFQCTDSKWRTWRCSTPLVLSFDGAPAELAPASGSFDIDRSQSSAGSDWPTARTPWLALDRNGNGLIDDGGELFGSGTALSDGTRAENGFFALAELDADRDGAITPADPAYASIVLWSDGNRDRQSQPSELQSLASRGVTRIDLGFRQKPRCDERGNCEIERSVMVFDDGGTPRMGQVIDVHLMQR
ncbi:MAG: hypothetical protein IT375_15690 [Polyangiaceae bacterium]|nr:hypothetical protein [Polyangiaceae bacterium]